MKTDAEYDLFHDGLDNVLRDFKSSSVSQYFCKRRGGNSIDIERAAAHVSFNTIRWAGIFMGTDERINSPFDKVSSFSGHPITEYTKEQEAAVAKEIL